MVQKLTDHHFRDLLSPLFDAGWSELTPSHRAATTAAPESLQQIALRRSCMVVGAQLDPEPRRTETLTLLPVAAHLDAPDDGIGFFDAVDKPVTLAAVSHGLGPFVVEGFAAELGLLDPARFTLPAGTPARERVDLLVRLYGRYVGRVAAKWRGGNTLQALRALDDDEPFSDLLKTVIYRAPNVMPDPVPMAAAIGITLDCWRNTELENLHGGSKALPDVVMAKLNIATTRAVRQYVTVQGIDWDGVGGVLLDAERQISHGRTPAGLVGDEHWQTLLRSIEAKLDNWVQIETVAGPEATLRLAAVMGSTDYTSRWWGNGWWSEFSDQVLRHLEEKYPELLELGDDEFAGRQLASDLFHTPDTIPDTVLKALIDPPDGKGLRHGDLPDLKVYPLRPPDRPLHESPARRVTE